MKDRLPSLSLGSGTPSVPLHRIWHPIFYQTLQFLRCFDKNPGTPVLAAHLSILFYDLGIQSSLENLHNWLESYVSSFIFEDPRDQADLSDKTLAVAVYLFVCDNTELTFGMPEAYLIDYIEYASSQDWFNNTHLAYYCHFLREHVQACENIHSYFTEHFSLFVDRQHVPSIAQSLIVLDGSNEKVDKHSGYSVILNALAEEHCSTNHIAWGLAALSSSFHAPSEPGKIENFWGKLEQSLDEYMTRLLQESKIPVLLAMLWGGIEVENLRDKVSGSLTIETLSEISDGPEGYHSHSKVCIQLPGASTAFDSLSLVDLAVALFAIYRGRRHKIVGVAASEEDDIQNAMTNLHTLKQEKGIVISRLENFFTLLLTLFVTAIIAGGFLLYFLEAELRLPFVFKGQIPRDLDVTFTAVACIAFMIAQILAFRAGKSPISMGLQQLPLLRNIPSISRSISTKLQNLAREGNQEK